MINKNNKDIVTIENITDLNLKETLNCGQCFRWEETADGEFKGVVKNKVVTASMNGTTFILKGATNNDLVTVWADYFDTSRNYKKIQELLGDVHPTLKKAIAYAPGIRILKQEPWEALCSFIISQNNNIPRIKGIIKSLCELYGDKIDNENYSFPTPFKLIRAREADLEPIKSGFRAKYILDAVKKVGTGEVNFQQMKTMPLEEAREYLMQINGVGPKVADCVLLYGLQRLECFPIDVWMKRAMKTLFPDVEDYTEFGKYAGVAQQYIFHYSRMHPELFDEE
ncbi:8-oxoguanine DNA glycosylase [Clostridia bacterium]|nr:8-oxoguanine DNA glycosylase [Clostridia bacterium]